MLSSNDRSLLVKLFRRSGIFYLRNNNLETDFINGTYDMSVHELEMDSLAAMEFCIAVEMELNIEVLPHDLAKIATLTDLTTIITCRQGDI
jgi:acyl carrier protein